MPKHNSKLYIDVAQNDVAFFKLQMSFLLDKTSHRCQQDAIGSLPATRQQ